jgi:hypothetical protein
VRIYLPDKRLESTVAENLGQNDGGNKFFIDEAKFAAILAPLKIGGIFLNR